MIQYRILYIMHSTDNFLKFSIFKKRFKIRTLYDTKEIITTTKTKVPFRKATCAGYDRR